MPIRKYNPTSAGSRFRTVQTFDDITTSEPHKPLVEPLHESGGRNNRGQLTSWWRGGGHKRMYRLIDFKRRKFDVVATVERLEYDPNRTAFIALVRYADGELAYILAPQRLKAGDKVVAGEKADIKPGNAMPLKSIPVGTIVHNVEMKPGGGGKMARAAGSYVQLVGRDAGYALLRLASGEVRMVRQECMATVGAVSNPDHVNESLGKAGRTRWMGVRPTVRGTAMNPIDHPHGGGEGRTKGGRHPVTPWGIPTKGYKTRSNKRSDAFIIRRANDKK